MVAVMRAGAIVGAAMLLSACTFETALTAPQGEPDANDTGGEGAESTGVAACKTPDASGLVVCLEFEDSVDDGVLDDSSLARRNARSTGFSQIARGASMAADVGPMASTYVQDVTPFDLAGAYTLAAWVKPDSLPPNSAARGVMDHEGQYAMIVSTTASGAIHNRCQHTGVGKYEFTERLPVGQWSFMACTWDGTQLCAWRWASATDHERFCHTPTLLPATAGTTGLAVGHLSSGGVAHSQFDGALDSLQVYARGMTEAQLCALAGQPAGCMPCDLGCI
jgi:hypothetical protein